MFFVSEGRDSFCSGLLGEDVRVFEEDHHGSVTVHDYAFVFPS